MLTKRLFSDVVVKVGDVVRQEGRVYKVTGIGLSTANQWRGKYRYETELLMGSNIPTSGIINLPSNV